MTLSRRTFLQLSGVLAAGAVLPDWAADFGGQFALVSDLLLPKLRALWAVPVYAQPDAESEIMQTLWPDSTHTAEKIADGWIKLESGWVQRAAMQPMIGISEMKAVSLQFPQIVTVQAPVAVVRAWVGPNAPIAARVGFGGVLWAQDRLLDDLGREHVAVAESESGPVLGWTLDDGWTAISDGGNTALANAHLQLDSQTQSIGVWRGGTMLHSAVASSPQDVAPGIYYITGFRPTVTVNDHQGAAWCLQSDGPTIYGAYWHNDYGQSGNGTGWEVMPWFSRHLSRLAVVGSPIIVT